MNEKLAAVVIVKISRRAGTDSEFSLICALKLPDFHAAFVELESGHGLDAARSSSLLIRIDINLCKNDRRKFFLHFFVNGRDHLAWSAPRRREVNDDQRLQQTVSDSLDKGVAGGGCMPRRRFGIGILEESRVF